MNFRQAFFKYYDRAISTGVCSFGQTGIKKDDFTKLCTDPDFVLGLESLSKAMDTMKLSESEKNELLKLYEEALK